MPEQIRLESSDELVARLRSERDVAIIRAESAEQSLEPLMGDIETLERKLRFANRTITDLKARLNKEALVGEYADEITLVFERWRSVTGHTRCKLDDARAAPVRARLKAGRTVEEFFTAIEGAVGDPWLWKGKRMDELAFLAKDDVRFQNFVQRGERVLLARADMEALYA